MARPDKARSATRAITVDDVCRQQTSTDKYLARRLKVTLDAEVLDLMTWAEARRLVAAIEDGEVGGDGNVVGLVAANLGDLAETRPPTPLLSRLFGLLADETD